MRTDKRKPVFTAGGFAVTTGADLTDSLRDLQMLLILMSEEAAFRGTVINVCRFECTGAQREKIQKSCNRKNGVMLLREQLIAEEEKTKYRFKKVKVQKWELVIAAGGDGLFELIDEGVENFRVLPRAEALAEVLCCREIRKKEAGSRTS